jgi:serine/threonine protein kinase
MTPERWSQIQQKLEIAIPLEPTRRAAYLEELGATDPGMREELESLLAQADPNFLKTSVINSIRDENGGRDPMIGRRLGPYEVTDLLGMGGMGEVYRAFRADDQYKKRVAIKLVRAGHDSTLVLSRFKNERQILASLDHSNIARLLDGGTTQEGVPYLVMELIEGQPIDEYSDAHRLDTTSRLRLFIDVCSAVKYAHSRLIVHRDLKPGNILVTADGQPKLLDFGIAKILDPGAFGDGLEATMTMLRVLTPAYASPEQVRGETITTASDVYSLGVVLYELLTGQHPYRVAVRTADAITRAVLEFEPEKPSSVVGRAEPSAAPDQPQMTPVLVSAGREGSPDKLRKRLSGDLDNIVLMALRKEPARRYASVEQFAEDIRRHLENLPVSARKDTIRYHTSKFVVRHKAGVTTAALVTLTLLAGLAITMREAGIAQQRFNDVRELANSLIFDVHDSIKDLPGSTPARKLIVDRALTYLNRLAQSSRGDLSLQRELATAYARVGTVQGHYLQNSLGDTKGSLDSYQRALGIRKQVAAHSSDWNDRVVLAEAHRLVANQQWALGAYPDAVANISAAVAISEALNSVHPKYFAILNELAFDYEIAGNIREHGYAGGRGDPAVENDFYRKAVATDEVLLTIRPDDPTLQDAYATDLNHIAGTLENTDLNAALGYYNRELEIEQKLRQRFPEPRYARGVAHSYSHIGEIYDRLGDLRRASDAYTRGLEVSLEIVRVDPKNAYYQQSLAIAYSNTAHQLSGIKPSTHSLEYAEKGLEIMRRLVASAPENKQQQGYLGAVLATNGSTLINLGKPDAALKELEEGHSLFVSLNGTDPIDASGMIMICAEKMGEAEAQIGNPTLAAEYFSEVLKVVEPALQTKNFDPTVAYLAADSYSGMGDLQMQKARHSPTLAQRRDSWMQAESWYRKSLDAWHLIEHPYHTSPADFDAGDPAHVAKNLQLCEIALKLSSAAPRSKPH